MKLRQETINEIEESLSKGGICEITSTNGMVVINHYPDRADLNLPLPIFLGDNEESFSVLRLSTVRSGERVDLSEHAITGKYLVIGIKGTVVPKK